jgi:serine/threonine-protein kinase
MADLGDALPAVQGGGVPGVGALLNGKYRIERVLGKGGMGIVYAAHHEQLGERVAIKMMLEDVAQHPEAVGRFLNEARAAAKIKNEHVARVMDVGTVDLNGAAFMALEYLEGHDLGQLLAQQERLPVAVAVDYVLQALEAIAQAHALGIVHRDLKPANLFLARQQSGDDVVKVLDFGISKVETGLHQQGALTATRTILGSPLYMSPEQLRSSRSVDARADIWSLGVILYELTTGTLPFDGESPGAIFAAILEQGPPPIRERQPEVSADLERIILKCLQRRPDDRYGDVAALASDLALHAPEGHGSVPRIRRTLRSANASTVAQGARGAGPAEGLELPTSSREGSDPGWAPSATAVLSAPPTPSAAPGVSQAPNLSAPPAGQVSHPSALSPTGSSWGLGAQGEAGLAAPRRARVSPAVLAVGLVALLVVGAIVAWGRAPRGGAAAASTTPTARAPATPATPATTASAATTAPQGAASPTMTAASASPPASASSDVGAPARSPAPGVGRPTVRPAVSAPALPEKSFQRDRN